MGLAARRKVTVRGAGNASNSIVIPKNLKVGKFVTIAADRLMIVDPRGTIAEEDLLEFLERYVEPCLWPWLKEREARNISTNSNAPVTE